MLIIVACIASIAALVIAIKAYQWQRALRDHRRIAFIRRYRFPPGLLAKLHEKHPALTAKELQLVTRGLRKFFLCNLMARGRFVSMPSQVVDDLWHEFILFTRIYKDFCNSAFGEFLHHTPAVVLSKRADANEGLRRAWRLACEDENIEPRNASRLPLLFALDHKLNIPNGFSYRSDCSRISDKKEGSNVHCATDFHDTSFDGGTAGFSDGGSTPDNSLGSDSGDSGSTSSSDGSGSSCGGGGGCGGGGD